MAGNKETSPSGALRASSGQDVSAEEAELLGAFPEDALSEADALAAAEDPRSSPAEALFPPRSPQ
jgi:hypothetical protein